MQSTEFNGSAPQAALDKQAFLTSLEEMLELEPNTLQGPETLESRGWDSLAVISCQAMLDERFGIRMDCDRLLECDTFDTLFQLAARA
jgi:acyl carrier protein